MPDARPPLCDTFLMLTLRGRPYALETGEAVGPERTATSEPMSLGLLLGLSDAALAEKVRGLARAMGEGPA